MIPIGETILVYGQNLATGKRWVSVLGGCHSSHHTVMCETPGDAINALVPYREMSGDVVVLIDWLSDQCKLTRD